MSGKLDQSLDEILSTQRRNAGQRRPVRRSTGHPAAKPAPVGGIRKTAKPTRNSAVKPGGAKTGGVIGESKVVVSNLPKDVSEAQIKEYFTGSVGHVKRVELSYGPGGISRGIATVIFSHADGASKAFTDLNGLLIDNRPVKVEVVVASADLIPQPKSLGQRISQPKAQPKSAAADKGGAANGAKGPVAARGDKKVRRGRSARPSKKTAEELDSEMADYFVNTGATSAAPANGTAAAGANGDAPMDEIM